MRSHRVTGKSGTTKTASRRPARSNRGRSTARILGALLMVWGTLIAVTGPVSAGVFGTVGVDLAPATVTAGQTGVPATYTLMNGTNGTDFGPVTVTDIEVVPSCGNFFQRCPLGGQDPGVFRYTPTGTGETGTVCAGRLFNITPIAPADTYLFTPADGLPLVLDTPGSPGGADGCRIDFFVDVLKVPTKDARPLVAGVQTASVSVVTFTAQKTGVTATDITGVDETTVNRATPSIGTITTPAGPNATAPIGSVISDQAVLSGLVNPIQAPPASVGTITFNLFGPSPAGPPNCAGAPAQTSTMTAPANGTYSSPPFTPTQVGTYQYVASYSGDNNNNPVSSACGDEPIVVQPARPTITTTASTADPVPGGFQISDTATLAGGFSPTGTIRFDAFGPINGVDNPTCAGAPAFTSTVAVNMGNAAYSSGPFFVPSANSGTYRFIATFIVSPGDTNNVAPPPTACADTNEDVLVPATPLIATAATPAPPATVASGGTVQDTATITNGLAPIAGSVTFNLYSPADPNCLGTVFATQTVPVGPDPNAPADLTRAVATTTPIGVSALGTYRFTAQFNSTNANNVSSRLTACGEAGEVVNVIQATPAISTAVTAAAVLVGGTIQDTATITGASPPITGNPPVTGTISGTVTFNVYGPDDPTCAGAPFTTQTVDVGPDLTAPADPTRAAATTTAIPVTAAGAYRFRATYSGDTLNAAPPTTGCNDANELVTVTPRTPILTTTASGSVPVGGTISDTATLTSAFSPTGTVTFTVFGPFNPLDPNPAVCTTPTAFGTPNPVTRPVGAGGVTASPSFTVTQAGVYRFVASYSGDANNVAPAATGCNDPAEVVVVTPVTPILTTLASAPMAAGGTIHDTATLSGGFSPTGTITFTLFGPFDPADPNPPVCTTPSVLGPGNPTNPVSVDVSNGNGNYDSPDFTVTQAGIYRFVASYDSGTDPNNTDVAPTACNDVNEDVLITPQVTQITTNVASGSVQVGQPINDTATLAGGTLPTGTIIFTLFGPINGVDNPTCAGPAIFTSTVPVAGNGMYPSGPFTPTTAGTYRFIAVYSGDANNVGDATSCNEAAENVVVTQVPTGLTTVASPSVVAGEDIFDTAILTGGVSPTGSITFELFGPDNDTCATPPGPAFTSTVPVTGAGSYQSEPFTTVLPGTYRFQARYTGDTNNAPAGPTDCTDAAEDVLVRAVPALTTVASDTVPEGGTISDTAQLSGGVSPGGTITFDVFGPFDPLDAPVCAGPPIFTSTVPVNGNGTYLSGDFVTQVGGPAGPGIYRFQATYSGDAANEAVGPTDCADPDEDVIVTPLPPQIGIEKSATPLTLPEPGGTFTFNLVITNPGPKQVTITSLGDDVYGDLANQGTCDTALGTVLAPGDSYSCSFPGDFTGLAPDAQTDIATVTAVDQLGTQVSAQNDAVVSLTPVPPSIAVVKTASPPSLPEPGGVFTFTVVVTNTSVKPLTLTVLDDDVYGPLDGQGTCTLGATLAASGGTYSCTFPGTFNGVGGQNQTDTVTTTGVDQQGTSVSATDDAIVAITSDTPSITVQKSVFPSTLPEPGGTFTFTATVNNTSTEVLTLTSFVDNIYGDLNGQGTCSVPQTLAVGGSYTCTFPGDFFGSAPNAQTDTVTARAVDALGRQVMADDDAVVTLTPVAPTIAVVKTASPPTRPEPGGNFTFTVVVTNTGINDLTITRLTDDVYGDLDGQGTCAIGALLPPGGTYTCSFVGPFTGLAPANQTDTVTVVGTDARGQTATATDDATVGLTPVPPTIEVIKTPNPTERPAPGGPFDFTVTVNNTTFEVLTLTVLTDNVYGDLNGQGSCSLPQTLAVGGSYTCTFTGNFAGTAGQAQTDIVTARAQNSRGQEATDTDDATVRLTPAPPPPPPPVIRPPTNVPPVVQGPLARTGFGMGGPLRLAVAMIIAGFMLILGTWRRTSLSAVAVPAGVATRLGTIRKSRAERTAARLNAHLPRSRASQLRWQAGIPGRSRRFRR